LQVFLIEQTVVELQREMLKNFYFLVIVMYLSLKLCPCVIYLVFVCYVCYFLIEINN